MKILVVDNYDSFVYNLVHYIEQLGDYEVTVKRNDEITLAEVDDYDKILLSPGPGIPSEAGLMLDIVNKYKSEKPILGVCLGHQAIAEVVGCELENMDDVLHGVATNINVIAEDVLYKGLPTTFKVGRYHSWQVKKDTIMPDLIITAEDDNGSILSFRHKKYDVWGVQYHPESVLTEHGLEIINNWLNS